MGNEHGFFVQRKPIKKRGAFPAWYKMKTFSNIFVKWCRSDGLYHGRNLCKFPTLFSHAHEIVKKGHQTCSHGFSKAKNVNRLYPDCITLYFIVSHVTISQSALGARSWKQGFSRKSWRARGDLNPCSPAFFQVSCPEACASMMIRRLNPDWATGPNSTEA
jgi:hypothetical protein